MIFADAREYYYSIDGNQENRGAPTTRHLPGDILQKLSKSHFYRLLNQDLSYGDIKAVHIGSGKSKLEYRTSELWNLLKDRNRPELRSLRESFKPKGVRPIHVQSLLIHCKPQDRRWDRTEVSRVLARFDKKRKRVHIALSVLCNMTVITDGCAKGLIEYTPTIKEAFSALNIRYSKAELRAFWMDRRINRDTAKHERPWKVLFEKGYLHVIACTKHQRRSVQQRAQDLAVLAQLIPAGERKIAFHKVSAVGLRSFFAALPEAHRLECLQLANTPWVAECALPSLKYLDFRPGCKGYTGGFETSSLESLSLQLTGRYEVRSLAGITNLQRLYISGPEERVKQDLPKVRRGLKSGVLKRVELFGHGEWKKAKQSLRVPRAVKVTFQSDSKASRRDKA